MGLGVEEGEGDLEGVVINTVRDGEGVVNATVGVGVGVPRTVPVLEDV